MKHTRVYQNQALRDGQTICLDKQASVHVAKVLRLTSGAALTVFNGEGGEYPATITDLKKHAVFVTLDKHIPRDTISPLHIHLGQGLVHGEKMDLIIQKATELGVAEITPLMTAHCAFKLNHERQIKRKEHWEKVAISACEQSGRNDLPVIHLPQPLNTWLVEHQGHGLIADPRACKPITDCQAPQEKLAIAIGPEGGFHADEVELAHTQQFQSISLGPRILRTETAALATVTLAQSYWGDV